MITYILENNEPLTDEEIAMLEEAKKKPVVYDDDCPCTTPEMLSKFKRVSEKSAQAS